MLDFVDDESAGVEGLSAMGGGNHDDHRGFLDLDLTHPVHRFGMIETEPLHRIRHDALSFFFRDRGMRFIFKSKDVPSLVVIAHGALEHHHGT